MKRVNGLFEKVISMENLRLADRRARRGKPRNREIGRHDANAEANLSALRQQLANGTFKTSEYAVFEIHDPKDRLIYRLPYYPDRILHHAIMNVMAPVWQSVFTADTYCCIAGRGIQAGADAVKRAIRSDPDGCRYCLKIDIRKYYPSIDHGVLKDIVRRKIKHTRLLALLDGIIDSAPGLPIGNYISQYLANLYLAYFDHWVKEQAVVRHYFRYADDMVFLHGEKTFLRALLNNAEAQLKGLKLQVKPDKQIFPVSASHRDKGQGVDFLGYVFFLRETRLRKHIKKNLARHIAKINHRRHLPDRKAFLQEIAPWWGWLKHADTKHLIHKLNQTASYEIKF